MARIRYSLDFKVSAAKLVIEQGRGLTDVAPSTMQYWVQRFGTLAARTPAPDDPDSLRRDRDDVPAVVLLSRGVDST